MARKSLSPLKKIHLREPRISQHVPGEETERPQLNHALRVLLCTGAIALIFTLFISVDSGAQTLNAELERLLSNNCSVLGASVSELGPNLSSICDIPGTSSASSSGGGSASSQASGTVVTQKRISEVREGEENSTSGVMENAGFGIWISADYEDRERDMTTFEDGYDASIWGVTLGGDKSFNNSGLAGIAISYHDTDGDFDGGGGFSTDSYGVTVYGSYFPSPELFVDASIGYTHHDYDVERSVLLQLQEVPSGIRTISGTISGDNDGKEFSANLLIGYDVSIDGFTVGPRVGVAYLNTDIDGYTESGSTGLELVYEDRDRTSLQSIAGIQGSMSISTGFGVLSPQAAFEWVHEFDDDQESISVRFAQDMRSSPTGFSFQNEQPDRDFFNLRLGLVAVLPQGVQPFAEFRTILGHDYFDSYAATAGVRIEL